MRKFTLLLSLLLFFNTLSFSQNLNFVIPCAESTTYVLTKEGTLKNGKEWYSCDGSIASNCPSNASFELYWDGSSKWVIRDLTNGFDMYEVAQNTSTPPLSASTSTSAPYTDLESCGNFVLDNVPLPVELTFFKGQAINEGVKLTWQTASEKNNEGFEIQRSTNGEDWENIGFVQGNGTTVETNEYNFTDANPISGINYYRLKQMDFDGQFEYSHLVNVTKRGLINEMMSISPNPVQNELNIVNGQGLVTIYNILGQPIQQFAVNNEQFTFNTTDLTKGQYILHIQEDNGSVITQQFVK